MCVCVCVCVAFLESIFGHVCVCVCVAFLESIFGHVCVCVCVAFLVSVLGHDSFLLNTKSAFIIRDLYFFNDLGRGDDVHHQRHPTNQPVQPTNFSMPNLDEQFPVD